VILDILDQEVKKDLVVILVFVVIEDMKVKKVVVEKMVIHLNGKVIGKNAINMNHMM
jgi:hypothetical protein